MGHASRRQLVILALGLTVGAAATVVVCARLWGRWPRRSARPQQLPAPQPAKWVAKPERPSTNTPAHTEPSPPADAAAAASPPFAIDLAKPLRITWPLDIGPDISPDRKDSRLCLRCRQGANEFLTPGPGDALYAFRLSQEAAGRAWFRMRYCDDGVGEVECNNSLLVSFDGQPATLIGNDNVRTEWAWRRGPPVRLSAGVHWVRLAMREDGPLLDRMVLSPEASRRPPEGLDKIEPTAFGGFAGQSGPVEPQRRVQEVELFALPTRSLVIGAGHVNEVTVCASWQGRAGEGFEGTIGIGCATAPGLTAKGQRQIACGPAAPFARQVVELEFAPSAPRRAHKVVVSVADPSGKVVFRDELRFLKGYAWAFLGPFRHTSRRERDAPPATGDVVDRALACERSPRLLARRLDVQQLGLAQAPLANGQHQADWKLVADGSCYDWAGVVDLRKVYGPTESAFAYAVTWLHSEHSLSRRAFSLQADDAAWLWMNGCFLVQLPMALPREANRLWTSGPLRRGASPVVIKLTQARHYWGFRLDVVDWHWHGRKPTRNRITGLDPDQWPRR